MSDAELSSLGEQLSRLAPRPARLDRDRVLFEAGRASAPRLWPWQAASACGLLASVGLAALLLTRAPQPGPVVERVVLVPVPSEKHPPPPERAEKPPEEEPPPAADPAPPPSPVKGRDRQLEENLIRYGLDALGPPPLPAQPGVPVPGGLFDPL